MISNLSLLRNNFQEIYLAACDNPGSLQLVANLSGTRIYEANHGWGFLWCLIYRLSQFVNPRMRLNRLKQAIIYTHAVFQREIPAISKFFSDYQACLQAKSKGYVINEKDFVAARKAINQWNLSTAPFLKMMPKLTHRKLNKLFQSCFREQIREQKSNLSTLFFLPIFEQLLACQKIIKLEGLIRRPLPLALFKKILKEKPLEPSEIKQIEKCIKQINQLKGAVSTVHRALIALVEIYKRESNKKFNVTTLEAFLEEKGCTLFQQKDIKHLQWRKQQNAGSKIYLDNFLITLDRELSCHSQFDQFKIFEIKENSYQMVAIAQNRAILAIRQAKQKENPLAIGQASFLKVSQDGRIALLEKLQPLNKYKWRSTNEIHPKDLPAANALIELFRHLIQENYTPANFTSKSLWFNNQFKIIVLYPLNRQSFDFNALEDIALECSKENLKLFDYLMTSSGLSNHTIARFYQEVIRNEDSEITPEDLACIYKIDDPRIVDRAVILAKKAHTKRLKQSDKSVHISNP